MTAAQKAREMAAAAQKAQDRWTLAAVQQCVAYWQERLSLRDWKVTVELVDADELTGGFGSTDWCANQHTAYMRIRRPEQFSLGHSGMHRDSYDQRVESTIIHELIHLLFFASTPPMSDTVPYNLFELALNSLAGALVDLGKFRATTSSS